MIYALVTIIVVCSLRVLGSLAREQIRLYLGETREDDRLRRLRQEERELQKLEETEGIVELGQEIGKYQEGRRDKF